MKSYLIDEIAPADVLRIRQFLSESAICSTIETLFWVRMATPLLTPIQQEHVLCQPHVFAVETGQRLVKTEFYLRTLRDMSCPCQGYCSPSQAHFIIEWVNEMLKNLSVGT